MDIPFRLGILSVGRPREGLPPPPQQHSIRINFPFFPRVSTTNKQVKSHSNKHLQMGRKMSLSHGKSTGSLFLDFSTSHGLPFRSSRGPLRLDSQMLVTKRRLVASKRDFDAVSLAPKAPHQLASLRSQKKERDGTTKTGPWKASRTSLTGYCEGNLNLQRNMRTDLRPTPEGTKT